MFARVHVVRTPQMSANTFAVTDSIIINAFQQIEIPARHRCLEIHSVVVSQPGFSFYKLVIRIQFYFISLATLRGKQQFKHFTTQITNLNY